MPDAPYTPTPLPRDLTRCTEDVTRQGESQPCDKPAVAVRIDPTFGGPYPVCAHHARADMVPLAAVIRDAKAAALREAAARGEVHLQPGSGYPRLRRVAVAVARLGGDG